MATNSPNSPRQKMINLMYLVFIALMAMNIPAEVLDGLVMVESSIDSSIKNTASRNQLIMEEFQDAYNQNKTKVGSWYEKASDFKKKTDSIYYAIQSLKLLIFQPS